MLKWSPEPFASETPPVPNPVVDAADFEPTNTPALDADAVSQREREFRREAGFTDTKSLMSSLTAKERAQVYELVEIDDELRTMIHDGAGEHELERYARRMSPSIRADGRDKVLSGATTLEEVLRVTRAD